MLAVSNYNGPNRNCHPLGDHLVVTCWDIRVLHQSSREALAASEAIEAAETSSMTEDHLAAVFEKGLITMAVISQDEVDSVDEAFRAGTIFRIIIFKVNCLTVILFIIWLYVLLI